MRTDSAPTPSTPTAWLRAGFARAQRRLVEQAPGWSRGLAARWRGRWPLVLAAVAVVAVAALLAFSTTSTGTPSGGHVRGGERFSRDELTSIGRALDAKHIGYRVDDDRVEVAADKVDDANDAVAKLQVGLQPLAEIEKSALEPSVWDTPAAKEQRQQQARNQKLASMIRRIDGISGAWVEINRPPRRLGQRTPPGATAFVYLEAEGDRDISPSTVQNIVGLVSSFDPDVGQEAVSIYDRKAQHYAVAHDPAATAQTRDRAREEELGREIAGRLDWIKGVQVSVRLVALSVPAPVSVPVPVPTTVSVSLPPLPPEPPPPPPPPPPAEELHPAAPPRPSMAANEPLELGPEGEAAKSVVRPKQGGITPGAAQAANPSVSPSPSPPPSPPPSPSPAPSQAQVLVKVPRSYYRNSYLRAMPGREPSLDDLQPLMTRVETSINTAVRHVVGAAQLGEVRTILIPDDPPAPPPPALAAADAWHATPGWVVGGVGIGAGAGLIVVLVWLAAARRPAPRPAARADRGRYKIDEAPDATAGPGPTERVRELIRLNPEAAASVLHRWTGQGGPVA